MTITRNPGHIDSDTRHVLLLCRSHEQNGISYHCDTLISIEPDRFVWVRTVASARRHLARHGQAVRAIFALSDIEYMVAAYLCRSLRLEVPILLGVFHPRQWESTLDGQTGLHRAAVFRRLLKDVPGRNILASSRETIVRCQRLQPQLNGGIHLLLGPLREYLQPPLRRGAVTIKVCTVGRYVDFKVATVLAMAGVVAALRREGVPIEYHVFGDGPSLAALQAGVTAINVDDCIQVHPPIPTTEFATVVAAHDLFFGMGGAVVQAAMIGVPAMIAIQGETRPLSYGWFSDFDHRENPMFGDPHEEVSPKDLAGLVREWVALPEAGRTDLGERCRRATAVFGSRAAADKILEIAAAAGATPAPRVTLGDLLIMRLESYWIRFTRRKGFHT